MFTHYHNLQSFAPEIWQHSAITLQDYRDQWGHLLVIVTHCVHYWNCPFTPSGWFPSVGGNWLGSSAKGMAGKTHTHTNVLVCSSKKIHRYINMGNLHCLKTEIPQFYLQFWNCGAVYLVSRMPKPSIRASKIPPIMAEPIIVSGPPSKKNNGDH